MAVRANDARALAPRSRCMGPCYADTQSGAQNGQDDNGRGNRVRITLLLEAVRLNPLFKDIARGYVGTEAQGRYTRVCTEFCLHDTACHRVARLEH